MYAWQSSVFESDLAEQAIHADDVQDFTQDERRALAQQSRRAPPTFGSDAKQSIINDLHMRMLAADKVCCNSV